MTWILPAVAPIVGTSPAQRRKIARSRRYQARHPDRVKASADKQRASEKRKTYLAEYAIRNKEKLRKQATERMRRWRTKRRMLGLPVDRRKAQATAERSSCLREVS